MIEVIAFFVRSSLYVAGRNVDGEVIGDVFEVIAEAADGRRWAHMVAFHNREYNEEASAECGEPVYSWVNDAEEEANAVCRLQVSPIDPGQWHPVEAAYGSASHDEAELVELERELER